MTLHYSNEVRQSAVFALIMLTEVITLEHSNGYTAVRVIQQARGKWQLWSIETP